MFKRPTPRQLQPNIKRVAANATLFKGITNNKRVYDPPVYFALNRNYAQLYANARLGVYVVKRPLKLLELTSRTIKWLLLHSDLSQLNRNRLAFIMGSNMTVRDQIAILNKIIQNEGEKAYRRNTILANIAKSGATLNSAGGRKSFRNLNLMVHKALCAFCKSHGYDGMYTPELTSPYHPRFGAELILCDPRNALVSINFPLKN
jgi:hypothetical protein